ncbi:hypothetical protein WQ54_29035 [Bacillus sp. SA1-12]|uniref:hypothetical protein n=1 Tax=Bacillus sp. SA1-12 TaxID=1455638 RepID=UPI0006272D64|nr:hypothetical protein [Bacillus sp. SA1-12]KKI88957.1 hypothetical protein WQ54_29035 [Bacillus sp. SA1-12]
MENENCGIMTTTKKTDIHGYTYTEVHLMDFRRERIWHVNFENLDNELIPEGLREYIRENSEKIKEGSWHYSGDQR